MCSTSRVLYSCNFVVTYEIFDLLRYKSNQAILLLATVDLLFFCVAFKSPLV
jgi:hypothetical protein